MIVAGFGFRSTASIDSLLDALTLTGGTVNQLAAPSDKAETPVFRQFAAQLGLPVIPVPSDALKQAETLTHSSASQIARGTGSVAEAAALIAAGPGAQLIGARVIATDRLATCALAKGENT